MPGLGNLWKDKAQGGGPCLLLSRKCIILFQANRPAGDLLTAYYIGEKPWHRGHPPLVTQENLDNDLKLSRHHFSLTRNHRYAPEANSTIAPSNGVAENASLAVCVLKGPRGDTEWFQTQKINIHFCFNKSFSCIIKRPHIDCKTRTLYAHIPATFFPKLLLGPANP